jgi:hypothetical protein
MNPSAKDALVAVRVFLSAPMLMIFGILLIAIFKKDIVHRILGIVLFLSGAAWAIKIIVTFIEEAA